MNLKEYFSGKSGVGVISTSNDKGEVNSAIYAKPHVNGTDSISFIMRDRLTRANLQSNPQANYLFIEHEHGFHGIRLSLTMTGEEQDEEKIASLSRRPDSSNSEGEVRYLVSFRVERALVLIGGEEIQLQ